MNISTKKTIIAVIFVIICTFSKLSAQVLPGAAGVNLFCQGADLTLPIAPTGEEWIVKYSATQTTTPATGITLVPGNKIPAADLKTGYYYLSSKSTTPGACESELQEIPVYVLKPLLVDFAPANFCLESPLVQVGSVTNPDATNIPDLAYQWYTVDAGGVETAISGVTTKDYTPSAPATVGTKKHRIKVGYVINGKNYCSQTADHEITVTPKPVKPTITPGSITGTASAVTF